MATTLSPALTDENLSWLQGDTAASKRTLISIAESGAVRVLW